MDATYLRGKWNEYKGKIKEQWGKWTDDDLDRVEGQRDQLLGLIQQHYGKAKDEVDRETASWERRVGLR